MLLGFGFGVTRPQPNAETTELLPPSMRPICKTYGMSHFEKGSEGRPPEGAGGVSIRVRHLPAWSTTNQSPATNQRTSRPHMGSSHAVEYIPDFCIGTRGLRRLHADALRQTSTECRAVGERVDWIRDVPLPGAAQVKQSQSQPSSSLCSLSQDHPATL